MTVAVDFSPGQHGHFLEYVINRYLFGIPCDVDNIFQSSGAVHVINTDIEYQKNKIAHKGHFTSFQHRYPYPAGIDRVVVIKHDPELDFVLLTNIYYRCHPGAINATDFNVEEIKKMHHDMMASDAVTPSELRANWFTKLYERHFELTEAEPITSVPVFDFDFSSFFSLPAFLQELKRTSKFLDITFKFDTSLSALWHDFMSRNQGYQLYVQAQEILNAIYIGESKPIPDDWKLQSYLNFKLAKTFDLYDGILYNSDNYPNNTLQVLEIVTKHIQDFDSRF